MTTYYPISSDVTQRVSDTYRFRGEHPVTGKPQWHYGVDIAAASGTRVGAFTNGVVTFAGWQKGYGNVVYIKHGDGSTTKYAHLSEINVAKDQKVIGNQKIGEVGNTGGSTGNHLHFEFQPKGMAKAIDPSSVLKSATKVDLETTIKMDVQPTSIQPNKIVQDSIDTGKAGGYEHDFSDGTSFESNLDTESLQAQLNSIQAQTTTTFLTELNLQLPSMMSIMVARLAMGEDIKVVSADMATRLVATSAINTYAENNWQSSGGKASLEASAANAIASYVATILITNTFAGGMNSSEYAKAAANVSIQTITTNERLYA